MKKILALTRQEKQEYVKNPYHCPYCGSADIRADHFEPEGLYCDVTCNICGKEWRDLYELVAIEEL